MIDKRSILLIVVSVLLTSLFFGYRESNERTTQEDAERAQSELMAATYVDQFLERGHIPPPPVDGSFPTPLKEWDTGWTNCRIHQYFFVIGLSRGDIYRLPTEVSDECRREVYFALQQGSNQLDSYAANVNWN